MTGKPGYMRRTLGVRKRRMIQNGVFTTRGVLRRATAYTAGFSFKRKGSDAYDEKPSKFVVNIYPVVNNRGK